MGCDEDCVLLAGWFDFVDTITHQSILKYLGHRRGFVLSPTRLWQPTAPQSWLKELPKPKGEKRIPFLPCETNMTLDSSGRQKIDAIIMAAVWLALPLGLQLSRECLPAVWRACTSTTLKAVHSGFRLNSTLDGTVKGQAYDWISSNHAPPFCIPT